MKQVNKDYIGIVKKNSGRFSFEQHPIKKSELLISELRAMATHRDFSREDMLIHLSNSPIFKFFALPFFEQEEELVWKEESNIKIKILVDDLYQQKTKAKLLDNALKLIEECDFRWNIMDLTYNHEDCVLRSFAEYESKCETVFITDDIYILINAHYVGNDSADELSFTVMKNDVPVLPYRSLVELYKCSEDTMESTMMFDPDIPQWENFMTTFVATANEVLEKGDDYFKKSVVEDGLMMDKKISQMYNDIESYLNWLTYERGSVQIEYSDNEADADILEAYNESYKEMHKLYTIAQKLSCAICLAGNLKEWSQFGDGYEKLSDIYPHMIKLAPVVLEKVEKACEILPEEFFENDYRSKNLEEMMQRMVAQDLRRIATDLRDLLNENNN